MTTYPFGGIIVNISGYTSVVVTFTDAHGNTPTVYADPYAVTPISLPDTITANRKYFFTNPGPWTVSALVGTTEMCGQTVRFQGSGVTTVSLGPQSRPIFGTSQGTFMAGNTNVSDISGAAPINSPNFTGVPTAPTPTALDNSTKLATTAYTDAATAVGVTAAETYADTNKLAKSANLSDVADAGSSRANIKIPVLKSVQAVATSNIALSGTQTIDGYAAVAGDYILAAGQTTGSQNGPWVVAAGAWTRPTDYATGLVIRGRMVQINAGTVNGGSVWAMTTTTDVTVDTTATTWQIANRPQNDARYAPQVSPTFTGTPTAPTPATADNSTKLATTAYVQTNLGAFVPYVRGLTSDSGVTDNTTVLNTAATALGSQGGTLYLPAGTYGCDWDMPANITLFGAGQGSPSGPGATILCGLVSKSGSQIAPIRRQAGGITLQNLTVDGGGAAGQAYSCLYGLYDNAADTNHVDCFFLGGTLRSWWQDSTCKRPTGTMVRVTNNLGGTGNPNKAQRSVTTLATTNNSRYVTLTTATDQWVSTFNAFGQPGDIQRAITATGVLQGSWIVGVGTVITAVTSANPAQITAAGHGLSTGDKVWIAGVFGATNVNNQAPNSGWTVTVIDGNTFTVPANTTSQTYSSNGVVAKSGATYTTAQLSQICTVTSAGNTVAATIYQGETTFMDGTDNQLDELRSTNGCSRFAGGGGNEISTIHDTYTATTTGPPNTTFEQGGWVITNAYIDSSPVGSTNICHVVGAKQIFLSTLTLFQNSANSNVAITENDTTRSLTITGGGAFNKSGTGANFSSVVSLARGNNTSFTWIGLPAFSTSNLNATSNIPNQVTGGTTGLFECSFDGVPFSIGQGYKAPPPSGDATGATDLAILTSLIASATSAGKTLVFPDGTYTINGELAFTCSYQMTPNTIIIAAAGYTGTLCSTPKGTLANGLIFSGGVFDANGTAANCWWAHLARNCQWVNGPKFRNAVADTVVLGDETDTGFSWANTISNPYFNRTTGAYGSGAANIWLRYCTDSEIYNAQGFGQEIGVRCDRADNIINGAHFSNDCVTAYLDTALNNRWPSCIADTPISKVHAGATYGSGTSTITDSAIKTPHLGLPVTGTGIPANSFVGTVIDSTSFTLVNNLGASVNTTAPSNADLTLVGVGFNLQMTGPASLVSSNMLYGTANGTTNSGTMYGCVIGPNVTKATVRDPYVWSSDGTHQWKTSFGGKLAVLDLFDIVETGSAAAFGPSPTRSTNVIVAPFATYSPSLNTVAWSSGVAFQPSSTRDVTLYIPVTVASTFSLTMGPTTGAENTVMASQAVGVGMVTLRVPYSWHVIITQTTGTIGTIAKVPC